MYREYSTNSIQNDHSTAAETNRYNIQIVAIQLATCEPRLDEQIPAMTGNTIHGHGSMGGSLPSRYSPKQLWA